MAISEKYYDEIMNTLRETASPAQKNMDYPEEIKAFESLADVRVLEMEANGHPFTVYRCSAKNRTQNAPLHVNIHGGGWYLPHKKNDLYYSCWLADATGGEVLSVDYTTSDKAPWDVMFEQCYEVIRYAFEQAADWQCNKDNISVGGYSAGGHLTAGLALRAEAEGEFKLNHQIVCYAPIDMKEKEAPEEESDFMRKMRMRGTCFLDLLFRKEERFFKDPFSNPYAATDDMLARLPRTLVITAGECDFRFEDEAYGLRLAQLGIETTIQRVPGAKHGFIPHFGQFWEPAARLIAEKIKEV